MFPGTCNYFKCKNPCALKEKGAGFGAKCSAHREMINANQNRHNKAKTESKVAACETVQVASQGTTLTASSTSTKRQATTNVHTQERATIKRCITNNADGSTITTEDEVKDRNSTAVIGEFETAFRQEACVSSWKSEEVIVMSKKIAELSEERELRVYLASREYRAADLQLDDWLAPPLVDDNKQGFHKFANVDLGRCLEKHREEWQGVAKQWRQLTAAASSAGAAAAAILWKAKYNAARVALGDPSPVTRLAWQAWQDLTIYVKNYRQEQKEDREAIAEYGTGIDDQDTEVRVGPASFCGFEFADASDDCIPKAYHHAHTQEFGRNFQILLNFEDCERYEVFENMVLSAQINLRFRAGLVADLEELTLVAVVGLHAYPLSMGDTESFPYFTGSYPCRLNLQRSGNVVFSGKGNERVIDQYFICAVNEHVVYVPTVVAVRVFAKDMKSFSKFLAEEWVDGKFAEDNVGDGKGVTHKGVYFSGKVLSNPSFAAVRVEIDLARQAHQSRLLSEQDRD